MDYLNLEIEESKLMLNTYFDNIYVLYIDDKELTTIKSKLEKKNIIVQYFKGFNGHLEKDIYEAYVQQFNLLFPGEKSLNCGSFGHTMSFLNILNDAKVNNYNKILILEPDIYFCKDFDILCDRYLGSKYLRDSKLIYFGASQNKFYTNKTWDYIDNEYTKELEDGYYYSHYTLGTFAISIDHSVYGECIELFKEKKVPTDVSLLKLHSAYPKDCFVIYPNIICCDVTTSKTSNKKNQIETIRDLRWTLDYEFDDTLQFQTEIGSWYCLVLDISSWFNDYTINIVGVDEKQCIPPVTIMTKREFTMDRHNIAYSPDKLNICFLSTSSIIRVKLNNLFISDSMIMKMTQSVVKKRIGLPVLRKYRKSDFSNYYIKNLYSS